MLDAWSTARSAIASALICGAALALLATANHAAAQPSHPVHPVQPAQPAQGRDVSALTFESLGAYGGSFSGVVVSGTIAFASRGSQVDAYDVADPAAPRLLGTSARLPTLAPIAAVAAGRAYLVERLREGDKTAWYDQLHVMDVSNPAALVHAGTLRLPLHALDDVVAIGTMLFAASGEAGIGAIDVSDPARPRLAATTGMEAYVTGIGTHGSGLLAAARDVADIGWLLVLDVGADGAVRVIGRVVVGGRTGKVASSGTFAFVESWQRNGDGTFSGATAIVDLANPLVPRTVGLLGITNVVAFSVARDRLYALAGPRAVRDSNRLWSIDTRQLPATNAVQLPLRYAAGIAAAGDHLLLAAGTRGLATMSHGADAGSAPLVEEHLLPTLGSPMGVALTGGLATVTDWDGELWIVDVRDPGAAVALGMLTLDPPYAGAYGQIQAGPLVVRGDIAYVARRPGWSVSGGLHVVDVADPYRPVQIGQWDPDLLAEDDPSYVPSSAITGYRVPELLGDRLWFAGSPALTELDVADPARPRFVGYGQLPYDATSYAGYDAGGLATDGQRLFVAAYNQGVYALDLSAGGAMALETRAEMPGLVTDVAVVGDQVLAVGLGTGLRVLDADTLGAVRAVQGIQAGGIEVFGTTAYVLTRDGVVAFDVSDPALPVRRGMHWQPLEADMAHVAVEGDLMALAGASTGLELLRLIPGEVLPAPTIGPTLTPWPTRTPGTEPPRITPIPTATSPDGTAPATDVPGRPRTPTQLPRPGTLSQRVFLPALSATRRDR